ncbi:hypothetical protein HYALB_00001582 [Hymenoscyphus albidus]|uniref:Uncharacterized protein n=1 Tax=Hymenoscyphus albidus TaxID=595503 RepID=A0A9N9LCQ5_9HELO|nr:hypothetical protein HYALB_00001582 [Hymenoscyphus albidus]
MRAAQVIVLVTTTFVGVNAVAKCWGGDERCGINKAVNGCLYSFTCDYEQQTPCLTSPGVINECYSTGTILKPGTNTYWYTQCCRDNCRFANWYRKAMV